MLLQIGALVHVGEQASKHTIEPQTLNLFEPPAANMSGQIA